jgi:hypothetical protein
VLLRPRLKLLRVRLMLWLMLLRLVLLWLVLLRLMLLRLILLRLARIELRIAWRERLAADMGLLVIAVVVTVIVGIAADVARLLLERGLTLAQLFLGGGDQAEIMFGVLIIIFGGNCVSGALRVTGQLEIFFGNVGCGSSNFYILPIGFVHTRQWILVMATLTIIIIIIIATAHALVLTVSHDLLFRQPLICSDTDAAASLCRMSFNSEAKFSPYRLRAARKRRHLYVTVPQQSGSHRRFRARCRKPFVMRVIVAINAHRTDETSRSNIHGLRSDFTV